MGRGTYIGGSTLIRPWQLAKPKSEYEDHPFIYCDEVQKLRKLVADILATENPSQVTLIELRKKLGHLTWNGNTYKTPGTYLDKNSNLVKQALLLLKQAGMPAIEVLDVAGVERLKAEDRLSQEEQKKQRKLAAEKKRELKRLAKEKHERGVAKAIERKRLARKQHERKVAEARERKKQAQIDQLNKMVATQNCSQPIVSKQQESGNEGNARATPRSRDGRRNVQVTYKKHNIAN